MNVQILKLASNEWIDAEIKNGKMFSLPSIVDGWVFNFNKHSKVRGVSTYVLIAKTTPELIEGCLIFQMQENKQPYMAYIEIAPHNKGNVKIYDTVAGCLIAFACRLSFILGKEDYRGWLAFDVHEQTEEDQIKLMSMYSEKYYAKRIGETTMIITPKDGEILIDKYLNKRS